MLSIYCSCKTFLLRLCLESRSAFFSLCREKTVMYWNLTWHFHQSVVWWVAVNWEILLWARVEYKVALLFCWWAGVEEWEVQMQKKEVGDHLYHFYAPARVPAAFLLVLFLVTSLSLPIISALPGFFRVTAHAENLMCMARG